MPRADDATAVKSTVPRSRVRRMRRVGEGPGERGLVVGEDLPFDEPEAPDVVLENDGSTPLDELAAGLWRHVRRQLALTRE